jgi:hypothetical protein
MSEHRLTPTPEATIVIFEDIEENWVSPALASTLSTAPVTVPDNAVINQDTMLG